MYHSVEGWTPTQRPPLALRQTAGRRGYEVLFVDTAKMLAHLTDEGAPSRYHAAANRGISELGYCNTPSDHRWPTFSEYCERPEACAIPTPAWLRQGDGRAKDPEIDGDW